VSGISRHTGATLAPDAHLAQSIGVLLSTPVGSRVLRRDYGSDLPRLIDAPVSPVTMIDVFAATAEALATWEPRLTLRRVRIDGSDAGRVLLSLDAQIDGAATIQTIPVEVAA